MGIYKLTSSCTTIDINENLVDTEKTVIFNDKKENNPMPNYRTCKAKDQELEEFIMGTPCDFCAYVGICK